MSELSGVQKAKLEKVLRMGLGYVLDFSHPSFQSFVFDSVGLDILDDKYSANSGSKANRLRAFWSSESNFITGTLILDLLNYRIDKEKMNLVEISSSEQLLLDECVRIATTLKQGSIVEHLDAIQANNQDKDFVLLAKLIRDGIEENQPEAALDRLHTFVVKYVRELCRKHSITFEQHEALHGIFGKYVKHIVTSGLVRSTMTERILKYSINVIDAFNEVRNSQSFAHDNPVLNYQESILIFNNISSSIKFINEFENTLNSKQDSVDTNWPTF